nr:toxin VasX [Pseudomonas daroniae]
MPFALQSRPLGVRLARDGYLYIIDSSTGCLHEYQIEQGAITKLLWKDAEVRTDTRSNAIGEPHLIFPRSTKLHVAYSELQWTARKCTQVLASREDREHFMQAIDLSRADPQRGGTHLLTRQQAQTWLAEVVENKLHTDEQGQQTFPEHQRQPVTTGDPHPEELHAYTWEDPPLFRDTQIGELTRRILPAYEHDALFLVLRDDIGVMRDLAQYQDKVVGWIEEWIEGGAQPGTNERDYVLACYIESLSQISEADFDKLASHSQSPAVQAMLGKLEALPEADRAQTRGAVLTFLNNNEPYPSSDGRDHPAQLQAELDAIRLSSRRSGAVGFGLPLTLTRATERYYTRTKLLDLGAQRVFVESELDALIALRKEQGGRVKDMLRGAKFGQRGIDDLIDRPAMDAFLADHRPNLARWNTLLDRITADRTQMVTEHRFHRAAWYYDARQAEQVGLAFATQYACLKDICRSDVASEALYAWLEENPQYDRPLFHTLPLNEQSTLAVQYALIGVAGYAVANALAEWTQKLKTLEQGKLPALDELPEATRAVAVSAQAAFDPALTLGIGRAMETFYQGVGQQKVPELDELFRKLPKVLPARLLDAAQHTGLTFTFASEAEKAVLQRDLRDVIDERGELRRLLRERKRVKASAGHKSANAQALLAEIRRVRAQLDTLEPRLAAALSPIAELPENSVRVAGAAPGRAGITLILPPAQLQEVAGGLRNLRNGYSTAGSFSRLGDGVGLAVFVAQMVNLVQTWRETMATSGEQRELIPLFGSIFATGAAGFAAAQAIADTALSARSTQLVQGLQNHALEAVHVQMGKLHVVLGGFGYFAGAVASAISSLAHHGEWLGAVRNGNARAQQGAALALAGSSGMLASNSYGLWHTGRAVQSVLQASTPAAKRTAWAVAGTRLSSVFLRFNIAGAFFTALELGGTWWYNRNDTTPHDDWLSSTPWSRDAAKRQSYPLATYQQRLLGVIQAPSVQVEHGSHGSWWRDWLLAPASSEIILALPGLSRAALAKPLAGRPTVRLGLAAYRIRSVRYERAHTQVQWHPISELIVDDLSLTTTNPLKLRVPRPAPLAGITGGIPSEDLLLDMVIETLDEQGHYRPERHIIRLSPHREGDYAPAQYTPQGQAAPLLLVDPLLLPEPDDANR